MKPFLHLLSVVLPLLCLFGAAQAEAREVRNKNSGASTRYVRALSVDRYPIGARDFYYQFAESRVLAPAAAVAATDSTSMSELAAQVDSLASSAAWSAATPQPGTLGSTFGLSTNTSATIVDGPRASAQGVEENMSGPPSPPSPLSRLALPIAALGLMLFVARRRSVL